MKTRSLIVGVSVPILLICSIAYSFSRLPSGPEALSIAIPTAYRSNIVLRHKDGTTSEHSGIELCKGGFSASSKNLHDFNDLMRNLYQSALNRCRAIRNVRDRLTTTASSSNFATEIKNERGPNNASTDADPR